MTVNITNVKNFSVYKELELEKAEKIKYAFASIKMTRKQSNKIIELLQQEVSLLLIRNQKLMFYSLRIKTKM